jgi:acyl dehydratase
MKTTSPSELQSLIGTEIGTSEWLEIDQGRIDTFAEVTEDRQFIHVNKELAEKTPFGGTIAHGFLTLSLLSHFSEASGLVIEGVKMGINYGFEKIRFLAPVPNGSRVRGRFFLKSVLEKKEGNFLITYQVSVDIEGSEKPALVADWLTLQLTS